MNNFTPRAQQVLALQSLPAFKGYTKWSQCRSEHLRTMIMRTMTMMAELSDSERTDVNHPVVLTFNFLVLCLIRCLEIGSQSNIEILHINRLTNIDIAFDFTAVMDIQYGPPPPMDVEDNPFKIIVDNTKE